MGEGAGVVVGDGVGGEWSVKSILGDSLEKADCPWLRLLFGLFSCPDKELSPKFFETMSLEFELEVQDIPDGNDKDVSWFSTLTPDISSNILFWWKSKMLI